VDRAGADVVADLRTRLVRRMAACGEIAPRFIDAPAHDPFQRQVEYSGGSKVS
jgi:hypothetical protein